MWLPGREPLLHVRLYGDGGQQAHPLPRALLQTLTVPAPRRAHGAELRRGERAEVCQRKADATQRNPARPRWRVEHLAQADVGLLYGVDALVGEHALPRGVGAYGYEVLRAQPRLLEVARVLAHRVEEVAARVGATGEAVAHQPHGIPSRYAEAFGQGVNRAQHLGEVLAIECGHGLHLGAQILHLLARGSRHLSYGHGLTRQLSELVAQPSGSGSEVADNFKALVNGNKAVP